ncbi:MAG: fructose-6-phosphate aldolase [Cyclobacteriaceae bacterium]|nr:fructose-6-phosphate aldolase [Cyclobacteriaceae bacterium]
MKIFIDTGDVEAIRRAYDTGMVDGVTTNPTHIANSGRPFKEVIKEICSIVPGPVSAEAMGSNAEQLVQAAEDIAQIADNIVIKIPMNVEGLKAVPVLEDKGIKTNVTMIFSSTQCALAMKAGATFVSIVLSRLDAIANESDILIEDSMMIKSNFNFKSEVLAASLKTQNHALSCFRAGADIITIPESLLFQMYKHSLTTEGLAQFEKDWLKVAQ